MNKRHETREMVESILGEIERSTEAPTVRVRRSAPLFFLVDSWGELLVSSPDVERHVLERARKRVDEIVARGVLRDDSLVEPLDDDMMLRIVSLPRGRSRYIAVFIEPAKHADVAFVVRRFGVTRRETEVLEALMAGHTNGTIAERLCISEATVAEHVKHLFKKTRTNKRSELVARIFQELRDVVGESRR